MHTCYQISEPQYIINYTIILLGRKILHNYLIEDLLNDLGWLIVL